MLLVHTEHGDGGERSKPRITICVCLCQYVILHTSSNSRNDEYYKKNLKYSSRGVNVMLSQNLDEGDKNLIFMDPCIVV